MDLERLYPHHDPQEIDTIISMLFSSLRLKKNFKEDILPIKKVLTLIWEWRDVEGLLEDVLIEMSNCNQIEIVKFVIQIGANINYNNEEALICSAQNGHLKVVKYLVSEGADIHADDEQALRFSAQNGHLKVVKFLVDKGADIHANDDCALRYSAENGHLEVVKYLVSKGADIHAHNEEALRLSAQNGHLEVVKFLVSVGADYKRVFSDLPNNIQVEISKYILSIKRIQRWILKIFAKPYYKDGKMGFLARQGWERCEKLNREILK